MAGQSRKWMILIATIWIQAFTGTNFDFSDYSSELKAVLGVSQVQLNYLATASDLGKVFGWSSGLALLYLPLWVVMFIAAFMGLVGYGLQWLVIENVISLPYFAFLNVSFNGLSAALYNLAAKAINPSSSSLYLLLNAFIPLITSIVALIPILRQPPVDPLPPDAVKRDQLIFIILNFVAVITGLYVLFLHSSDTKTARILFGGAIFLLLLPLGIPGIIYARGWFHHNIYSSFCLESSSFILIDHDDLDLHKSLLRQDSSLRTGSLYSVDGDENINGIAREESTESSGWCCEKVIEKDQLVMLGEEHCARMLISRLDFWLYFFAYLCGGTIGLVYSNNLGQIAQSLGQSSRTSTLTTLYSAFSFFGRLLSAAPDFIRTKFYFARTGWLAIALLPTPIAFFLLAATGSQMALQAGTGLIGLSSGFIFAAAVSVTSELFGPNSVGR